MTQTNRFHLAIPAGDLSVAMDFYCNVLGCEKGNSDFKYPDAWVDINFWGNELTLHSSDPKDKSEGERHNVDMGNVSVPHFGVHLDRESFDKVKASCIEHKVKFVDEPYIRFEGEELEQETMFIEDPNGNALEIKTMKNPDMLWNTKK